MINQTFSMTEQLSVQVCKSCAGSFAISEAFRVRAYELGGFKQMWHCPYCNKRWGYGEGDEHRHLEELDRKQRELEEHQRALTAVKCSLTAERLAREASDRKCRRITRRIAAGVCPCCNRTFTNLARHMTTKHPEKVPSISMAKNHQP